jgi:hypothetical protein
VNVAEGDLAKLLELREAWAFDPQQAYPSALPQHLRTDPTVDPAVLATAVACEQVDAIWEGHGVGPTGVRCHAPSPGC